MDRGRRGRSPDDEQLLKQRPSSENCRNAPPGRAGMQPFEGLNTHAGETCLRESGTQCLVDEAGLIGGDVLHEATDETHFPLRFGRTDRNAHL